MKTRARWLLLSSLIYIVAGCTDGNDAAVEPGSDLAQGVPPPPLDCDPLTPGYCGFPYPNNYWTEADSATVTGLRLALPAVIMARTIGGVVNLAPTIRDVWGLGVVAGEHSGSAMLDRLRQSRRPSRQCGKHLRRAL